MIRDLTRDLTGDLTRGLIEPFDYYIFTVKTDNTGTSDNDQFTLPLVSSGTYDFYIDWGDGSAIDHITAYNQSEVTHTYADGAGSYTPRIWGIISGWSFNNTGDALKMINMSQWGVLARLETGGFFGCDNMEITATDIPKFVTNAVGAELANSFFNCRAATYIPNLESWKAPNASGIQNMFLNAPINQNISNLINSNINNVTNMIRNTSMDQDLSSADFSGVTNGDDFASGTSMSTSNYSSLLISLLAQAIQTGVTWGFGSAKWSVGEGGQAKFDLLSGKSLVISDGGQSDANLSIWLNAHNLLKSSANPSDGTAVSSWKDLSDNGNDADEATNQPTFETGRINGESSVLYDTDGEMLTIANSSSIDDIWATGGTLFMVANVASAGILTGNGRFMQGLFALFNLSDGNLVFRVPFSGDNGNFRLDTKFSYDTDTIFCIEYDASSTSNIPKVYINTLTGEDAIVNVAPTGTVSSDVGNDIVIGNSSAGTRTLDGELGEIIIYKDGLLSSDERDSKINYLATKYGITLSE